jgi:predicted NAD/FAD-dependent oxidoreductase
VGSVDVVVVGAGWSGLSAASRLTDAGYRVVVVEKGRGAGGRSATRRQDGYGFDHGAQYFTARGEAFRGAVAEWRRRGLVATWSPRLTVFGPRPESAGTTPDERLVCVPGMNAVLSELASGLDCRFAQRVERMRHVGHWELGLSDGGRLEAHSVVLTAPPAQASALLGTKHPCFERLESVPMAPTWALMAGFEDLEDPGFDAAFDNEGPLSWLACNGSKPARERASTWIAHASVEWSLEHLERDAHWVAEVLYEALCRRLDCGDPRPAILTAHRWRYAQCRESIRIGCLWQEDQNLAVAGDWAAGNRIEGAWTSGQSAAGCIEKALRA